MTTRLNGPRVPAVGARLSRPPKLTEPFSSSAEKRAVVRDLTPPYTRLRGRRRRTIRRVQIAPTRAICGQPARGCRGRKGGQGWMPVYFFLGRFWADTARAVT
jgi:hypothetical protein